MLPSTGRVSSTNASRSKPRSNTKNDRIPQTSSRSKKNKVEAHHRKFKSSANKNNHVSDRNANVKNKMQKRKVAKSAKQKVKSEWKPTGRIFKTVGLKWIPTGRTFNLVGKPCPSSSSNDTSAIVVPLGHILRTNVISVDVPCPKLSLRYDHARESLSKCMIDLDFHTFNLHDFGFEGIIRDEKLLPWKFDYLGIVEILLWDMEIYKWGIFLFHMFTTLKDLFIISSSLVRYLRTDNNTEFLNQTLQKYTEDDGITHNTSTASTPQQNGIVERHNRMLVEADLGKLQSKANIRIFIGYSPSKKAHRIYNKRTRQIMETMSVQFDELTQMASEQHSSGPGLYGLTSGHISSGLVLNQAASTSAKPPTKNDWDFLFQPMFDEYFKSLNVVSTPHFRSTNSPLNSTNVEPNEEVAEFDNETFTNPFALPDTSSAESSSRIVDTSNMHTFQQPPNYTKIWTKIIPKELQRGNGRILLDQSHVRGNP
ncbi:integrase, catalytic region, zinc finger, CCHC-type containing protein [Tanacetum coccineum]